MAVAAPTSQIIFSCRLLQQLLRRNEENVFVSPAGLGLALGISASSATRRRSRRRIASRNLS